MAAQLGHWASGANFHSSVHPATSAELTLVTTDKTATALRISSQAPMFRALDATGRLNWVVNFQASTLISRMLLNRASRGARGKEATKRVMNPNCTTGTRRQCSRRRQENRLDADRWVLLWKQPNVSPISRYS